MNDNDIIKALECCLGIRGIESCSECPAYVGCNYCTEILRENALDLINRQKAEIEGLQRRIVFWREDLNYNPKKERSEAIKEFAERLNGMLAEYSDYDRLHIYEIIDRIEILEEEMTGEINGK